MKPDKRGGEKWGRGEERRRERGEGEEERGGRRKEGERRGQEKEERSPERDLRSPKELCCGQGQANTLEGLTDPQVALMINNPTLLLPPLLEKDV